MNLAFDQRGEPYLRSIQQFALANSDYTDVGAFEVQEQAAPIVTGVTINHGDAQRSMVWDIEVTFSIQVTLAAGAFTLTRVGLPNGVPGDNAAVGAISVSTQVVNGQTVATLTFGGANTTAGSLDDGNWTLTIDHTKVTATYGGTPMAADYTQTSIKRLFGDIDGDADVDLLDLNAFSGALFSVAGDPNYVRAFDYEGDGDIDLLDLNQFQSRLFATV